MSAVQIDGTTYHTGLLPTPAETIARMHARGRLTFAHEHPLLRNSHRAEFEPVSCRHFFTIVKNQGSQSSCTGFSASSAMNGALAKQGFACNVSAASIYAQINGGRDAGANVGDALNALQEVGCTPVGWDGIGDHDWTAAYRIRRSAKFLTEAKKIKIIEAVFCGRDVDAFMAGLASGLWAGQMCLGAGSNFNTDSNGWLPTSGPKAGINHALTATGGIGQHPKTGEFGPEGFNSWGSGWGNQGFFYVTPKWLRQPGQELWLCRATTIPD